MFLICYGTRPELIKLFPIINKLKNRKIPYKTMFTGQHEDLIKEFSNLVEPPDISLQNIMGHGQSINTLTGKILMAVDKESVDSNFKIIVQGDSQTSFTMALYGFNNQNDILHIEAGLRTNNLNSPFPEEANRVMTSHISYMHFCPTEQSVKNLNKEGIHENVYLVGNTVVDSFNFIIENSEISKSTESLIEKNTDYLLVTLHRRENRNKNFEKMWSELNEISKTHKIIYIKHPSVTQSENFLAKNINVIDPVNYQDMLHLVNNSAGIISDSGGLQEEAVCANKKILICRDTTERPETIDSGFGKLVNTEIQDNLDFLFKKNDKSRSNPYGRNVSEKIISLLEKEYL